jgi:hypothetical protein
MLNAGIGDLIMSRFTLDKINATNVYLSVSKDISDKFRNKEHYDFVFELLPLIFDKPRYKISHNQNYPRLGWPSIVGRYGQEPEITKLLSLCGTHTPFGGEYVVVFTKVRDYYENFIDLVPLLFSALESLEIKIVIVGERIILPNREYSKPSISSEIYSLYGGIPKSSNIIDMTYDDPIYDVDRFKRDCSILRDAKITINVGIGGNLCMSLALCNNTINLVKPPELWPHNSLHSIFYRMLDRDSKHSLVYNVDSLLADLIEKI